jgi:hypothetical protein
MRLGRRDRGLLLSLVLLLISIGFFSGRVGQNPALMDFKVGEVNAYDAQLGQNAKLTIQSSASNISIGASLNLSVTLSPARPGNVTIYQSINGSVLAPLINVTLSNGTYTHAYTPPSIGTYRFGAAWPGDDQYNPAEATLITVTVTAPTDTTPPDITDVSQTPPQNNVSPQDTVNVNATVTDDISGVKEVTLSYASYNETWINMTMSNLGLNVWSTSIPAFPYGTNVTYIIIAQDNANNTITTLTMGYSFQYQVIPEFPALTVVLPLFIASALATVAFHKRRR